MRTPLKMLSYNNVCYEALWLGEVGFALSPGCYPLRVSMINFLSTQWGENRSDGVCSIRVPASIHKCRGELFLK